MKIAFIISCFGHGRGGHFYSLTTIAEEIAKHIECFIIVIGSNNSPVINNSFLTSYFVKVDNFKSFKEYNKIKKIISKENATTLHAFDFDSHFFSRMISKQLKLPLFVTKAGGPNPKRFFPWAPNLFLFSKENLTYFKNQKKYRFSNLFFLPNRASFVKQDLSSISKIRTRLPNSFPVFLRISRLSNKYFESLKQSIKLIDRLSKDGFNAQLVIVGTIQDQSAYAFIKKNENNRIHFFTSDNYTINASKILDVADYVIATGRSIMEASSLKKVLLTPIKGEDIPAVINENNFMQLFDTNFSPRNTLKNYSPEDNYNLLVRSLNNHDCYMELKNFSFYIYENYFNIESAVESYIRSYKTPASNKIQILDLTIHSLFTLKHLLIR